jgi:Rrf2 family protein
MTENSRFAVAIHVLTLLAATPGALVTSEHVAGSVNTNPVVIRRLAARLAKAGLIESRTGAHGGLRLRRKAKSITLRDVFRAVGDGEVFGIPARPPNARCPVGCRIQAVVDRVFGEAQAALEDRLAGTTLADLLAAVAEG